jgi:hypothetical protein
VNQKYVRTWAVSLVAASLGEHGWLVYYAADLTRMGITLIKSKRDANEFFHH